MYEIQKSNYLDHVAQGTLRNAEKKYLFTRGQGTNIST